MLAVVLSWPLLSAAQDKTADPNKHQHGDPKVQAKDLADQVRDLQAKVAQLEAALKQGHQGKPADASDAGGMGGMSMGMGDKKKMGMGMMGEQGMGMMDMDMKEMMGMMGMGGMGQKGTGMGKKQMTAALPGFPGASHIYHVGAAGFFLDHPEHITLTDKQQRELARIKEKALLNKATAQRKIDQAEQELWELTGSDQPDAAKVEAKVREVEKLRGDQCLAFIRAVGEAAKVLTDEQRQAVLGTVKSDKADPHAGHKP